jgi:hypothetical protein
LEIKNVPKDMSVRLIQGANIYDFSLDAGAGIEAKPVGTYKIVFLDHKSDYSTQFYKENSKNVLATEKASVITISDSKKKTIDLKISNFIIGKENYKIDSIVFNAYKGGVTKYLKHGDVLGDKLGEAIKDAGRAGYTFKGFYTKKKGGTIALPSTKVSASSVYYAQYKANKIKVTFNANGGKVSGKKTKLIKKTFNSKIGKLPNATKKSKKFIGWFTKKKGGKKIKSSTKIPVKKVTYYAHWK